MRLLREALLDIRANWSHTALAALGLVLAVLASVAIVVAGSISRQVVVATTEQRTGRHVTMAGQLDLGHLGVDEYQAALSRIASRAADRGSGVVVTISGGEVLDRTGAHVQATLTFLNGSLDSVRRVPLLAGRKLPDNGAALPAGLLLNQAAAHQLGGLGTELRLRPVREEASYPLPVVGLVADGDAEPTVYAALQPALKARPALVAGNPLTVWLHRPQAGAAPLTSEFQDLARAMGVDPSTAEIHEVDQVAGVAGQIKTLQVAFLAVSAVALVVAAGGLLSVGLANLTERARELTVRRALGATRLRIAALLAMSGLVTGLLAAVIAIGISQLVVALVIPHVLDRTLEIGRPEFPWPAAALGLVASLIAALIGAVVPAIRSVRFDLADALRE